MLLRFDETEKASRAMAVMLEKTKAHLLNATPEPSGDAASPMTGLNNNTSSMPPAHSWRIDEAVFDGVISNHQWDNLGDISDAMNSSVFYGNDQPTNAAGIMNTSPDFSLNNDLPSQSQSNTTSPNQDFVQGLDFSIVGDMLDVRDNLDWTIWDNEVLKGQQTSYAEWPDVAGDMSDGMPGMPDQSMRYGNAMAGGSGPIVPGNSTVPGGTGSGAGGVPDIGFNGAMMDDSWFSAETLLDYNAQNYRWTSPTNENGYGQS